MRNLLIAGLAAMSLIAFGACGGDEEETSTKECTSNADCGEGKICGAEGKCVDDTSVTPGPVDECTTNDDCTDATKPVCDNGTCVADDTQSGNCPAGEYEIDGTCYAEGDECDPDTVGAGCTGNTSAYCTAVGYNADYTDYVYEIVVENCADSDMTCNDISMEGDSFGLCTLPCDAAGEEISMCDPNPEFEGDLNTYVCYALADGGFGAIYDDYETCSAGCDETKNACNTVDGWTCDTEYYGDGYCDCGCGIVDVDCADASYESCEYSGCEDGTHIDADDPTSCTSVPTEGDSCSADYRESCVDGVILYCDMEEGAASGTIKAYDCGAAECLVDGEGAAACYQADTACSIAEDQPYNECYEVDYGLFVFNYSLTMECSLITEGKYYYISTDYEDCSRGCEESTGLCVTIEVPAGWTSDPDYYGDDYCDCGGGIVDIDCADATYASCEYNVCAEGHPSPDAPTTCVSVDGEGDACTSSYETTCLGNVLLYCSSTTELVTGWDCGDLTCNPEAYDGCE